MVITMSVLTLVIVLIWLTGAIIRAYRQIRFYQIEEYKSPRYLRWLVDARARWLPSRPIVVWIAGTAISVMLSEAPGAFLPGVIAILAAIIAVWPTHEGEIKKAFVRTPRALRILVTAFVLAALLTMIPALTVTALPLPDVAALRFGITAFVGLVVFLLSPLTLIAGNTLMIPVEAVFRRRFVRRARGVLDRVQPTVIGITGSYGKTTTKTIVAQILNGRFRALPTPKSYNTLMGVCLAINNTLADDYSVDYFIAEMGAYVEDEIAEICDLVEPRIGIMIDVGPQHLERFGSLENTANAKYELIKALPPDGIAVFNWDSDPVRAMYERGYPETRIAVSKTVDIDHLPDNGPRFVASEIVDSLNGMQFNVTDTMIGESVLFTTPLLGQHNITNILLATAVAVHEGMSLKDVAFRVRGLQPAESRLVRQETAGGITIINDAYSANPIGAVESLRVLGMHNGGKRLLITPGMVELGSLMAQENRKLGAVAAQYASDVILIGKEQTEPVKNGLLDAGFSPERLQVVETLAEAVAWYQANLRQGDTVLFLNDLPDTY
jgi:UDP-N-acetylmuramoyl-tripeptide--D-alanyl-D-alanine ligase